jgi:NAD(P)H dehydrogenase (quinone)
VTDINVLVVFHSRTGRTEKLALTAAVGAVQAKANIRLRWLREAADDAAIESAPEWKENRQRMEKEYIAPREVDAAWADAIIIGTSGSPPELQDYLASLGVLGSAGKLEGKVGAALSSASIRASAAHEKNGALLAALAQLGFIVVPPGSQSEALERARLQGRRITEVARALKGAGLAG